MNLKKKNNQAQSILIMLSLEVRPNLNPNSYLAIETQNKYLKEYEELDQTD